MGVTAIAHGGGGGGCDQHGGMNSTESRISSYKLITLFTVSWCRHAGRFSEGGRRGGGVPPALMWSRLWLLLELMGVSCPCGLLSLIILLQFFLSLDSHSNPLRHWTIFLLVFSHLQPFLATLSSLVVYLSSCRCV